MKHIIEAALAGAMTYAEYRKLLTDLLAEGKTTGPNQTKTYLDAAVQNQSRMNRLDRRSRFTEALEEAMEGLSGNYLMLAITEGWCGDAAQLLPLFNHLAELSRHLDLKLVLRDENQELMDLFLTNGARGIPIIIFLHPETLEVITHWGPRPAPAQQMVMDYKKDPSPDKDYDAFNVALHTWYARDKTATTQAEVVEVLKRLEKGVEA
ncbi:thioredoxin family protein [Lewinella sp. W8]|uniref:thioredoxin family protein n=1 Tax=Lewinella sp. W8 TaxID=2528208 RepID=UPI001068C187|nr:thioredoxin family protein [Lewinella sp. W8]MTB53116.1 thioredoxin family protein [Lewinella sp. W8]